MQRYGVSAATEAFFGSACPLLSMGVAMLSGSIEDVVRRPSWLERNQCRHIINLHPATQA